MKLTILTTLFLLVSCGDKVTSNTIVPTHTKETIIEKEDNSSDEIQIIEVCEDYDSKTHTEIIMKVDGVLIAHFSKPSDSLNFLTVLEPAQCYTTTDGHACDFCLDIDGNLE